MHLLLSRQLRVWELEEALKLNNLISSQVFSNDRDQLHWFVSKQSYSTIAGSSFLRSRSETLDIRVQGA